MAMSPSSLKQEAHPPHPTLRWTSVDIDKLKLDDTNQAPVIESDMARPMSPDLDVWDSWPLADPAGKPVRWRDGELWFALAVPREDDPEERHHKARIHHFHRVADRFVHLGQTLTEGHTPGTREWSGSARFENGQVTLFLTVAGRAGDRATTFMQRIFSTSASLDPDGDFGIWSPAVECVSADGLHYRPADQLVGEPGKIKALRDPAHFRDADGTNYLLFTGSSAAQPGSHDGVIGLAVEDEQGKYRTLPPVITAVGVNNELERPHIVEHGGLLYLFWSTQRGVFAPGIVAPTGLYGAVASSISGPWQLLNGTGLVLSNPADAPTQCYSWWVLPDFSVASFVDYWGPADESRPETETRRARFGGTFAPFVQIAVEGNHSWLVR
ncbi:glycoside hydrolase family 68 protein [Croceicoccus sp. YJ47]|uniref:glycoside hydrolase family 68 protein n=1 Tax=Croceicoccus sp. YJ47 TaxID=2798724 RepID=UPI001F478566|nr:glycoside hydrolase family 68 protein [Croceicoccus sp. YJ47]